MLHSFEPSDTTIFVMSGQILCLGQTSELRKSAGRILR